MKNTKKLLPAMAILSLALVAANPSSANAESAGLGLKIGISNNIEARSERDEDREERKDEHRKLNADIRASVMSRIQTQGAAIGVGINANGSSTNRLPPGIQIAPGIEKRLENGKGLPKGLFKFLDNFFDRLKKHNGAGTSTASSTIDVSAPRINKIHEATGTSTADISWKTNEPATSELRFSTSSNVTASSSMVINSSSTVSHNAHLMNLSADTKYYYVIVVKDANGNVKTSETRSFRTKALSSVDVTAPVISFSTVFDLKANSAKLFWFTRELSNSSVWVSTSTPVSTSGAAAASSSAMVHYHNLQVSGLATSTTYFYALASTDAAGNTATTSGSFTTSI